MTRSTRTGLRTALAAGLVLVAAGCGAGRAAPAPPRGARVIEVAAAEDFWGSIAAQLGGRHVDVASIITNPDTDPHDYEPTASDGRTVAQARYVIENGVGYDPWAAKLVAANQPRGQRVLDVGRLVGVAAGANPHRWYYPADVGKVVVQITRDLQALDPADAAYFGRQQARFERVGLARYHQLLATIRARFAGTPVGASESIFVGLAQATGLDLVTPAAYLRAISEGSDPTAADKATADSQITHHRIRVFVLNRQNATPDVQALVREARSHGIPVVGITETMTPAGTTFQAWQDAQLEQLEAALAR